MRADGAMRSSVPASEGCMRERNICGGAAEEHQTGGALILSTVFHHTVLNWKTYEKGLQRGIELHPVVGTNLIFRV
jgi:hypothetical protein